MAQEFWTGTYVVVGVDVEGYTPDPAEPMSYPGDLATLPTIGPVPAIPPLPPPPAAFGPGPP
jgi:hypothetical protein